MNRTSSVVLFNKGSCEHCHDLCFELAASLIYRFEGLRVLIVSMDSSPSCEEMEYLLDESITVSVFFGVSPAEEDNKTIAMLRAKSNQVISGGSCWVCDPQQLLRSPCMETRSPAPYNESKNQSKPRYIPHFDPTTSSRKNASLPPGTVGKAFQHQCRNDHIQSVPGCPPFLEQLEDAVARSVRHAQLYNKKGSISAQRGKIHAESQANRPSIAGASGRYHNPV